MKTHFAAISNGLIVGTRSSTSRSIEGTGKFGPYTHAILRTERKTFLANPEHPEPIESMEMRAITLLSRQPWAHTRHAMPGPERPQ